MGRRPRDHRSVKHVICLGSNGDVLSVFQLCDNGRLPKFLETIISKQVRNMVKKRKQIQKMAERKLMENVSSPGTFEPVDDYHDSGLLAIGENMGCSISNENYHTPLFDMFFSHHEGEEENHIVSKI